MNPKSGHQSMSNIPPCGASSASFHARRLVPKHARWCVPLMSILLSSSIALADGAESSKLPDNRIRDAVEDELSRDYAIAPDAIDVEVTHGVVELSGTASNLLAKRHAIDEAQAVRGVLSVVDRIEVFPLLQRTDVEIRRAADQALLYDATTESWEIDVDVKAGVATLSGTVDSYAEQQIAGDVVAGVVGVREVDNRLEVTDDSDRLDTEIAEDVKGRLHWDALVDGAFIQTHVKDGVVTLTGSVGSASERERAHVLSWVRGVNTVSTAGLQVTNWARNEFQRQRPTTATDQDIAAAIKAALYWDPRVLSTDVAVSVEDGVATLRGTVATARARRAADRDARLTTGVIHTHNRLKVRANAPSGKELEQRVQRALRWNPYLYDREVSVSVSNHRVRLTGQVDSNFEKQRAESVVEGINGVQSVSNALTVANPATLLETNRYDSSDLTNLEDTRWYQYDANPRLGDQAIVANIRRELFWSPFVDRDDIRVYVDDGVATLAGTVQDTSEMLSAVENAFEGGASAVDNELRVKLEEVAR